MDPVTKDKCESRIRIAKEALRDLPVDGSREKFDDKWYIFLTASKNIYTILEQWSKQSPTARQWFGGVKSRRKNEAVADYMFHARNDAEHGLKRVSDLKQIITFSVPDTGTPDRVLKTSVENVNGQMVLKASRPDGGSLEFDSCVLPHFSLNKIDLRGGRTSSPPWITEFGVTSIMSPHAMAERYLRTLEAILFEASSLA